MTLHSFEALLIRPEGVGTWTFFYIPTSVSETFPAKGQVKVKGTVNGYPFRSTALPMGNGMHYLVVEKSIRDQIHAAAGDTVSVKLELDTDPRVVELPEDLAKALADKPTARDFFEKLPPSHKKLYVSWILSAKKEETRQRRVEQAIAMLSQGKKLR